MPFIGKQPKVGAYQLIDSITTSATATYALTVSGDAFYPESARNLIVSLNGITQAPESAYTVSGSNIVFDSALTSSDVIDYILVIGDAVDIGTPSDGTVGTAQMNYPLGNFSSTGIDDNADATCITISSAEKVGINNASPSELLSMIGTGGTAKIRFDGDSSNQQNNFIGITGYDDLVIASDESNSGTASTMQFRVDASEKMRIAHTGEIQIGGTTDAGFLDFDGTSLQLNTQRNPNTGAFVNTSKAHAGVTLSSASANGHVKFYASSANNTTASERARVTANGLTFNGDTAAANALDDYEEGTWTPTITGHGGGSTQTYSHQAGLYRKVGNLVYATCRVTLSSKGNMSGNYVLLQGWPFNFGGTSVTAGYGGINYFANINVSASSIWWELGGGGTTSGWLAYVSGSSASGSSYMNVSGLNNNFYFHCSAVYYTS